MSRNIPPLKSLQAFEAAARFESFLDAAEELCVTPGAVSRHIKQLEQYLGSTLFTRTSNSVTLTAEGKAYAIKIVHLFGELASATREAKSNASPNSLIISTLPVFSEQWLRKRIPSFQQDFPRTNLQIDSHDDVGMLTHRKVDAWVHYSDGEHPGFDVTHLFDEQLVPVCSPKFRESLPVSPTAEQIANSELLHDVNWEKDWPSWADVMGVSDCNLSVGLRFSLYSGAVKAAIDGLGIVMGHKSMIEHELNTGQLVEFKDFSFTLPKAFYLVIPKSKSLTGRNKKLKAWLAKECDGA